MKVDRQGGLAPGDVLDQNRADLVFDEAHALEDSLTAAWTERVDAIELEIVVNVLSRRSRLLRDIRSKAGGRPAATDASKPSRPRRRRSPLPQTRSRKQSTRTCMSMGVSPIQLSYSQE